MPKLAIIHTVAATIEPLKSLAQELIPGVAIVNFVDDSILPQLVANGGNVAEVEHRLLQYARYAEEVGADVLLEACSSVGEIVPKARKMLSIPVVRIDEPMAEEAVRQGSRVGLAATMSTTMKPTLELLKEKAQALGKPVAFEPLLIEGAYQRLLSGDAQAHDRLLLEGLSKLLASCDRIVLAQASMARVLPLMPEDARSRFLTSPRLAMERVKAVLEGRLG